MAIEATLLLENGPPASVDTKTPIDKQDVTINSRAYQLEMLEESLKRNIIVVMDTGTGKTHVAVLRIKKQLEVGPIQKLVWFLAPTKDLCSQQFGVLKSQISSVQIKLFTSDDNVARWTTKENWDAVLTNVNIVVSTYGVLHEALSSAFVAISSLSLIVFDEAHNCVKRSPGRKIMMDFYSRAKAAQSPVPHILGLTPSAVMNNNPNSLKNLEITLDSICRSPRTERKELLLHANRPELRQIKFQGNGVNSDVPGRTNAMESLVTAHESLNIHDDPEIFRLRTKDTEASRNQLEWALKENKTFMQDQMKSFRRRSDEICRVLGDWAADFYISKVVSNCIQSAESKDTSLLDWEDSEKQYLANALRSVNISPQNLSNLSEATISRKVRALLNFLSSCDGKTIGIIFVKERAIAYMLQHLLSEHPESRQQFRCGALVGTSQRPRGKRDICDLPNKAKALDEFRSGQIDFLIATSVLEEGIDVPQCELVICFDEPNNLKSYIQCRGRARLPRSKWAVLLDITSNSQLEQLEKWESDMELRYGEERKNCQTFADSEVGEMKQCLGRQFRVESTSALLDMENAKSRLDCFCSRLFSHYSVDIRPEYIVTEEDGDESRPNDQPLLRAKVILPPTLESSLRVVKSRQLWRSRQNATKDAAFEAYLALYHAGLVNENLLPLSFEEPTKYMKETEAIVEVHEQYNPWLEVARAWKRKDKLQRRAVTLKDHHGLIKCKVEMLIPADLSDIASIPIYWNASTELKIELGSPTRAQHSELIVDDTENLLQLAYGHRWEVNDMNHVVLFKAEDMNATNSQLLGYYFTPKRHMESSVGLPEGPPYRGHPFSFLSWLWGEPDVETAQQDDDDYESLLNDQFFKVSDRSTRRSDYLHPIAENTRLEKLENFDALPEQISTTDTAIAHFQFGRLIPSILHKLEVQLVVEELCTTLLTDVKISSRELIRTAISAPVAREQDNYQKLEFLGDTVLKFLVCVFVSSKHANWPEGYLSGKKDTIVSNSRLCRAAIERGLDKFILTKVFTGRNWRPLYVDNLLEDEEDGTRNISSKTIADVVESLIGAGWKMGGYSTSLSIIKAFLPEVDLPSLEVGRARLFDLAPVNITLPEDLHRLETLAGYSFKKKSLLIEAMSHSSYSSAIASYERLEFLGDALLEIIIVDELLQYEKTLSHSLMHLYKTVLVNNDYLGFIALEWNVTQEKIDLEEDIRSGDLTTVESEFSLPLWRFMRHGIFGVGKMQCEIERRHASVRHDIQDAISSGTEYPWALFARINIKKFYADIVESLLGAVWVDSGSLDVCKEVVGRMGILKYLHRIVRDQVHILHPREELAILADGREVEYNVQAQQIDDGSEELVCTVLVDQALVCEVSGGVSEDEVRTRAANCAVSLLRSDKDRTGSSIAKGQEISQ